MKLINLISKSYLNLGICIFLSLCLYLFCIQLIILPHLLPSLHMGHGLLVGQNDAFFFHNSAIELKTKIINDGWGSWELQYKNQSPVSIAAIFYYFFPSEPYSIIPFNALISTFSGLTLLRITRQIFAPRFISAKVIIPFLIMPSALIWISGIHKDGYFILGFFLLVYSTQQLFSLMQKKREIPLWTLIAILGFSLMWLARPYTLDLAILFFLLIALITFIMRRTFFNALLFTAIITSILLLKATILTPSQNQNLALQNFPYGKQATRAPASFIYDWKKNPWLPSIIDQKILAVAKARKEFTVIAGGSNIDADILFTSAQDLIVYTPRALQIGFFAPFPTLWFSKGTTLFKMLSSLEMIFFYFSYILFCFALLRKKLPTMIIPTLVFSLGFTLIQSLVICNIGTLYRMRFASLILIATIGLASFDYKIILKKLISKKSEFFSSP